nr:MAG: hypothetical protein [Marsupenaeus japonicus pemonivirus]
MVKFRSFILRYLEDESSDSKKCSRANSIANEDHLSASTSASSGEECYDLIDQRLREMFWPYISENPEPILNANSSSEKSLDESQRVCCAWIDARMERRKGVTTPTSLVYNAYVNERPQEHLNISKFRKAVKCRFETKTYIQGGVNVYMNVALKSLEDSKPKYGSTESLDHSQSQSNSVILSKKTLRRICRDWIDTRMEDRSGVTTPVFVLYFTYTSENGSNHLSLSKASAFCIESGIFVKVLDSRHMTRKRYRNNITAYENIALKLSVESKYEDDNNLSCPPSILQLLCEFWIDENLERRQGNITPIHVLYKTYTSENPEYHLHAEWFNMIVESKLEVQMRREDCIDVYEGVVIRSSAVSPSWAGHRSLQTIRMNVKLKISR